MNDDPQPTSETSPQPTVDSSLRAEPLVRRKKLHRIPLVPVAVALAAGIAAGRLLPISTTTWVAAGAAALLAAVVTFRWGHLNLLTSLCAVVTILALGAVHVRLTYFTVPDDHVVTYTGASANLATLRGRVATAPRTYGEGTTAVYPRPPQTGFLLEADGLLIHGEGQTSWRDVTGLVQVTLLGQDDRLVPGAHVELMGWMGRLGGPANPGQYDWSTAARRKGIHVRLSVKDPEAVTVLRAGDSGVVRHAMWNVRAAARQHLDEGDASVGGQLLNALIVGERHPALRDLNRLMVRGGVAHFLSISGLHLGIFTAFLYALCRVATLSPRRAAVLVIVVLGIYVMIAEPRPALLRSAIMAASVCLAVMRHRRYAALNALAGAAVVLLALWPMQLFSAGFQLSFVTVLGIVVLHGPVCDLLFGRWIRRRGLMVFRSENRVERWFWHSAADTVMAAVAISVTAFLSSAPLVAYHFGLFCPYAPFLTLMIFPIVLLVLVPGYVSIALAWPMPNLAGALASAAGRVADVLAFLVKGTEDLPGLSFELRPVGAVWVAWCYAALAALALRRRLRFGRLWTVTALLAVAGATTYTQWPASAPATAQLDLLAVGGGQCAVLRTPSGATYILDAGSQSYTDTDERILLPFLRHMSLPAPETAFISHADVDHYNALGGPLRRGWIAKAYLNDYFAAEANPSPEDAEFIKSLAARGVTTHRLRAGQTLRLDDRTRVEVLWPPAEMRDDLDSNDTSLVLRIVCDDVSLLVPGDLSKVGQAELTRTPEKIRSNVLVLPHHGGWKTTLPGFFDAVDPQTVLVSNRTDPIGPGRKDNVPRAFYSRIKTTRKYYSTPQNGWIRLRFGKGGTEVRTMR